ncbi:MAG: hypothetical protein AAB845_01275 [Patescibacteria group bacterium]
MYWMYLLLCVFAILTPEFIQSGTWMLSQDDLESLIIFGFATLGLLLYISKEKAFFQAHEEKVTLQKKTNTISKDLSQSYSYIGEMNRKLDVIQEVIFELPKKTLLKRKKPTDLYKPVLDAAKVFARTDKAALLIVDIKKKICSEEIDGHLFKRYEPEYLLGAKKSFWTDDKVLIVRSPYAAGGKHVFLLLEKVTNHSEDMEHLQILASQVLLLAVHREHSSHH